ncbi:MAG: aspartate/glutamate racemase family protein [Gammaproteobacteria bacterium]|nr:aspartate/glutamate racemase family protein [Gammaproteobacteria bacterium]
MTYPIIGIIAVTTPGAAICAQQLVEASSNLGLGSHHPEYLIHARPTQEYIDAVNSQDWDAVSILVLDSVKKLSSLGARLFIMPSNTPHYAWALIQEKINVLNLTLDQPIKFLNLSSVTIDECLKKNYNSVLLLGTRQIMLGDLYKKEFAFNGVECYVPTEQNVSFIDNYIKSQLVKNEIDPQKNQQLNSIIHSMYLLNKFDAIILGCTELPMILKGTFSSEGNFIPLIDTTFILAESVIKTAINNNYYSDEKKLWNAMYKNKTASLALE